MYILSIYNTIRCMSVPLSVYVAAPFFVSNICPFLHPPMKGLEREDMDRIGIENWRKLYDWSNN